MKDKLMILVFALAFFGTLDGIIMTSVMTSVAHGWATLAWGGVAVGSWLVAMALARPAVRAMRRLRAGR